MTSRLYLDNAATSFPKPPQVLKAMRDYSVRLGASAGRGAYREAVEAGRILSDCRRRLARLINAPSQEHIVFTLNCTMALNLAVRGLLRPNDHVVTTMMDHNSVLRPLHALANEAGVEATYVRADPTTGIVDADDVFRAVRDNTRLIAVLHASNVTGSIQPIGQIGNEARRRGILFLADAAQSAGHLAIDVQAMNVDLLAMPGHKGLLGPLGTGALYIRPGLERKLAPLMQGGTGSVSEQPDQPDFMPDRFESGSHNTIGLAGLSAALSWIEERTVESLRAHELSLCRAFLDAALKIDGLRVCGPTNPTDRVAVFSVRIDGLAPDELSSILESDFGILTRSGLHCAPFAHQTIGTSQYGGTTRISFGAMNTLDDVERCGGALRKLAKSRAAA